MKNKNPAKNFFSRFTMDIRHLVSSLATLTEKLETLTSKVENESSYKTPKYFVDVAQTFQTAWTRGDIETMKTMHKQHRINICDDNNQGVYLTGFPGWKYNLNMSTSTFIQSVKHPKCLKFLHKHCNLQVQCIREIGRCALQSPIQDGTSVMFCKWFTTDELIADLKVVEHGNLFIFEYLWSNGFFHQFDDLCACLRDVVANDHLHLFKHIHANVEDMTTVLLAMDKVEMGQYDCVNILKYMLSHFIGSTTDFARSTLMTAAKHGQCGVLRAFNPHFGLTTVDFMDAL